LESGASIVRANDGNHIGQMGMREELTSCERERA
jgi:hypothetical protein